MVIDEINSGLPCKVERTETHLAEAGRLDQVQVIWWQCGAQQHVPLPYMELKTGGSAKAGRIIQDAIEEHAQVCPLMRGSRS